VVSTGPRGRCDGEIIAGRGFGCWIRHRKRSCQTGNWQRSTWVSTDWHGGQTRDFPEVLE
jgi:hypothetical protein